MSVCAHHPRRVARASPDTIGPLYHPTGRRCSRPAGLVMPDDLDSTDLPDTPSQGAVMEAIKTRPPLTAARRPTACFVRHVQLAEPSPRSMWGCVSVIGLHPTPSASLYGVVGCVVALRATHCLQTVCDVLRIAIEERHVLLVGCCVCSSPALVLIIIGMACPLPMSYANNGSPNSTWSAGPKPSQAGMLDRTEAWASPTGVPLPAVRPPRRHVVLVTTHAEGVSVDGRTAPADAACVTMNTLLIPARV